MTQDTDTSRDAVEAIAAEFDYRVEMHSTLSTGPAGGLRTERGMEAAKTHSATAAVLRALRNDLDAALLREKSLKDSTEELRQLQREFNAVKWDRDTLRDQLAAAREAALEEARKIVARQHPGLAVEIDAIKSTPALRENTGCIHMTSEMAENCPTCNPSPLFVSGRSVPMDAPREVTPQEAARVLLAEKERPCSMLTYEWLSAIAQEEQSE